jgi:hypothetical protein
MSIFVAGLSGKDESPFGASSAAEVIGSLGSSASVAGVCGLIMSAADTGVIESSVIVVTGLGGSTTTSGILGPLSCPQSDEDVGS